MPSEIHVCAGVTHESDGHTKFAEDAARAGAFFLERHVLHPKTYPPVGFRPA